MSCHAINGMETISSPAQPFRLGPEEVDKLDFGYLDHHKVRVLPKRQSKVPMVNGLCRKRAILRTQPIADEEDHQPVDVAWPQSSIARRVGSRRKLEKHARLTIAAKSCSSRTGTMIRASHTTS